MRSRNIKADFFKDERVGDLSFMTRLLFIGLWCFADRDGKFELSLKRIKIEIFPYDNLSYEDIHRELTVIERTGRIRLYEVNGEQYGIIVNFSDHQKPHHTEKKSQIPDEPKTPRKSIVCDLTDDSRLFNGEDTGDIALIPDSGFLIPESRILIEDSPNPDFIPPKPENVFEFFESLWREHLPDLETGPFFYVEEAGKALLLKHSREKIEAAFKNYAEVLGDEKYFYNHRHTLCDFLKFKIFKFFDSMNPLENFLTDTEKQKTKTFGVSDGWFERKQKELEVKNA